MFFKQTNESFWWMSFFGFYFWLENRKMNASNERHQMICTAFKWQMSVGSKRHNKYFAFYLIFNSEQQTCNFFSIYFLFVEFSFHVCFSHSLCAQTQFLVKRALLNQVKTISCNLMKWNDQIEPFKMHSKTTNVDENPSDL